MTIIPKPLITEQGTGQFIMDMTTAISIRPSDGLEKLSKELNDFVAAETGIKLACRPADRNSIVFSYETTEYCYELLISDDIVKIFAEEEVGLFYGLQSLKQLISIHGRKLPALHIKDRPSFEDRGFYHDVTRGKVPTLGTLKDLVDKMSYFKLNQLQLYIEHTYIYRGQSEVWSVTDPLSADEIMALDAYCAERHIELVPSISTFGHLYEALQSDSFGSMSEMGQLEGFSFVDRMAHHTLDVTQEASLEFVERMIDDFIPLVRSNRFNICADETFDLGEGKNRDLAESVGKSRMYVDFLNKIIAHVKGHGKEVMFWGDVILNHPEHINDLPGDLICLNWCYGEVYPEENVKAISEAGFRQYLCPGACGWNTLMNMHENAYKNIEMMTAHGMKYESMGILNTDWGDFGHWNFIYNSFPSMIYGAAFSWGDRRSFAEMNASINSVFYRTDHDIMKLVTDISDAHYMHLSPLVRWLEKGELSVMEAIEATEEDIIDANKVLDAAVEALLDVMADVDCAERKHIYAFINSAEGVKLLNRCYLVIREQVCDWQLESKEDPWKLAEDLEYWLLSFKEIWLWDNKPSELYRIVDFIHKVTKWLRTCA